MRASGIEEILIVIAYNKWYMEKYFYKIAQLRLELE